MKSILKSFSEHGTFIQPDVMDYISSKRNPKEFASLLIRHLKEYPLVLTMDHIKNIEQTTEKTQQTTMIKEEAKQEEYTANKKVQQELLSKIYNTSYSKEKFHEEDDEYDEIEKEDQLEELDENETEEQVLHSIKIQKVKGWKPLSKEYESEIKIIKDITGKSTCEGTTQDFVQLFRNRYTTLRKILQSQRREMMNAIPINRIKRNNIKDIQLIGIVKDVRTTTNGHRLIELEDETGIATLIALKNDKEAIQLANEIALDEVIGVHGKVSKNGDLIIIQSIVFPDISIQHKKQKAEVPLCAAFLSDIHIGSKMFLEDEWHSFLKWINGNLGNSRQRNAAGKIKYLVVPGDVVDGIGIYPNQEKELSIRDIYRQYETLAKQFQFIPDHISIIIQPGNHDAVRPAEPQPAFEKAIQDLFSGKEIIFIGNPSYFSLHGIEVLSYHGQSLLDFATNIKHLNYNNPIEIMKIMLKKRHLTPTYGGYTPLAPEHSDYMIIDRVPDIFVTGHVHMASVSDYRGVTLINASSWQAQTTYQKMLNFFPDPAKLPIVDLKTGNATMMDFSQKIA